RRESWTEQRRAYPPLQLAGVTCRTGAAAVTDWLTAADFRWAGAPVGLLLDAVRGRDPRWLADLAHRVAARPVSADVGYELLDGLVRLADCPPPVTDAYVHAWIQHVNGVWRGRDSVDTRIRNTRHLKALTAGLFETADAGRAMANLYSGDDDSWVSVLTRITAEGLLERREMVDGCLARLLRGGPPADLRVFQRLLAALELTGEERRARTGDWLALAGDAMSTVAGYAQAALGEMALAGELTDRQLADLSASVLFRTEKKLVRSQLVLLGKVLAARPGAVDLLLPGVAHAFGQADADARERAVKLLERHGGRLRDDGVRDELVAEADQLSSALRARARAALGVEAGGREPDAYEETLPPPPESARLAPAPASVAELAEETGALLAAREADVAAFERVLDGLVRHARQDRAALLEALAPVFARVPWYGAEPGTWSAPERFFGPGTHYRDAGHLVGLVLAALAEQVSEQVLWAGTQNDSCTCRCAHATLYRAFEARVREIAHRVRTGSVPPFLLSTPTWSTGAVDPAELVDRLEAYATAGVRPLGDDFAQA
ncbi:DUF6493 family protein, partial [Streptomyces sp. UH6]|uniref:DUF7824 domain-containing protein n=1 Tax=Streptomyces sp. UH6 TaxID=2748379 RepID=UPI0017E8D18E